MASCSSSWDLSRGSIWNFLFRGRQPPTSKATFQLVAAKPVKDPRALAEGQRKVRICINDGMNTTSHAMFILPAEAEGPELGAIFKVVHPDDEVAAPPVTAGGKNALNAVGDRLIWVIHNFKVLGNAGQTPICDDGCPLSVKLYVTGATRDAEEAAAIAAGQPIRAIADERTPDQSSKRQSQKSEMEAPNKRARNGGGSEGSGGGGASSVRRALFTDEHGGGASFSARANGGSNLNNGGGSLPPSGSRQPHLNVMQPTHLIKDLNPYQGEFRIKGRVVKKSELRSWSNSRGQGHVFDITLQDSSGDIKVTGFNEMAEKFHPVFQENRVYFVEAASVKPANKNFNQTSHNYELSLHAGSKVELCQEIASREVPGISFPDLKSISEIIESGGDSADTVDVMGVVVAVDDVKDLTTRAGRNTKKREIRIVDDSGSVGSGGGMSEIKVTLWGQQAEKFSPDQSQHKVVAFKKVTVSEWQGKSLNVGFSASVILEPTANADADRLRAWFANSSQNNQDFAQQLAAASASGRNAHGAQISSGTLCTLSDIKSATAGNDTPQTFTVEASFISFKLDKMMYPACPTETCRKQVIDQNGAGFRCEKCDKTFPECDMRYIVQGTLADVTGYHYVTVFNEAGPEVFGGLAAKELRRLEEDQHRDFRKTIEGAKHRLFKVTLRSKMETWRDEKRLKLSVTKAAPVNRTDPQRLARIRAEIQVLQNELLD